MVKQCPVCGSKKISYLSRNYDAPSKCDKGHRWHYVTGHNMSLVVVIDQGNDDDSN